MPRFRLTAVLFALALPLSAAAEALTVSAAASLTNVFKELGQRFEQSHPGTMVRFNFAASGVLLQQMAQGAPVDVLASADQATMDRAAAQKLVDTSTRRDFAANSLVVIAPLQGGPAVASLPDLARSEVKRIAIGKPATVPVGNYTRQALESAGLWSPLQSRLVQADSVRQVLDYVARGEADAGFVYRTDAAIMRDKVKIVLTASGHDPVSYPVAAAAGSRHRALADRFIAFLLSAPGQEALARYGFGKP
ncbi:MAG: molybdate ABC transporter substrate-binding protein [Pigmentiphaga sp.]|uniref:molybdate ABC transporter substrate-binding protein n=1 Tax=Pigmentiphaga sp. TaxID=1977564 RepID=UPI0029B49C89|nr:molybdate ABC transporter substrate-binding protein [Pigmentiphaga sp.]MDX3906215.1 molybdate ABC transporter substrate-binding protein [Pigmentiphaga sp.]